MQTKKSEIWVGLFMLTTFFGMIFFCLKMANINFICSEPTYRIYASFDNICGLKIRSPVKVGGVVIGRIAKIHLNAETYTPYVAIDIQKQYNKIPDTSSLAIRTTGLLGEQYLDLNIGFEDSEIGTTTLKDGDTIQDSKSAIALEDIIGQFLYKSGSTK